MPGQYVYVILEGDQVAPTLVDKGVCKLPQGITKAAALAWVRKDVQELLNRHPIDKARIKSVEGNAQTKDPDRLHLEGVVLEAVSSHTSHPDTQTLVNSQIKRCTGFTNLAKYMSTMLNAANLQEVSGGTFCEAALVALSGLPRP